MRRSLKIIAWIAGGLAFLLVLLVGAVLILGNTSAGRVQIEKLVARLTGEMLEYIGAGHDHQDADRTAGA